MKKLLPLLRILFRPLAQLLASIGQALGGDAGRRRRRAERIAKSLLAELGRLGFTRKIVVAGGRRRGRVKRQRVQFEEPLLMTVDELWCPIDQPRLPTGVTTDDLRDETVLRSLMDRVDCSVRIDYLKSGKMCYVVRYSGSQFPDKFTINAVEFPEDAGQLAIPAGVNAAGDQVLIDLADLVHLLVVGATGGGKTTFQHAMITTLINRNTSDDIELWLIDLKRTEFNLYRPLVSKKEDGIVKVIAVEPEQAIDVLHLALREINRRNQLMEAHHSTSLSDLAQSTGMRLKRIVLIVDEFAQLTLNTTKLGKQSIGRIAENLMTRIASLGRSAGLSIVIATQMVQKDVLSGLIRANFENRIAFSTADWRQSQMVIESSDAEGLPPGRAVMRLRGQLTMVQTALITARQVRIEVDRVSQFGPAGAWGEDLELARFVRDAKLIITAACQNYAGEMARAKILTLEGIRGVMPQDRFNDVAARLERDGILEPGGPRKPRRVAKGFFGRPNLLDSFYGLAPGLVDEAPTVTPTIGQTVILENAYGLPEEDTVSPEQEAENGGEDTEGDTVYGLADSITQGANPENIETEPAPPAWWNKIEPPAPAPPAAAPARRARIAQPRRKFSKP